VAHELATPLGTIALVSCELERSIGAHCMNPSCLEDARLIRCEVDRCRSIIDRLNVDSDADLGTAPTVIPLKVLPDQLRGILSPEVVARFEAEVSPVAAGQVLEAPRAALMQALCVLIKNGAEADASGRPVRLGISLMEDVRSHAREVLFSVRDQGGGISPEIAERLGEPFLTTKPPGQGMGLGLYIVRLFAERLHGRLEFAAVPGGGTEARLALPLGPKA
jgi:two-component system sensor histidine kinase RegB